MKKQPKVPAPVEAWGYVSEEVGLLAWARSEKPTGPGLIPGKPIRVRIVPIVKPKPRTKRKERKK